MLGGRTESASVRRLSSVDRLRRCARRRRGLFLAVAGTAVAVLVVAANQPRDESASSSRAAAAAGHLHRSGPSPAPRLRLIHEAVHFVDRTPVPAGAPPVAAASGILVDVDDDTVLWARDPHVPRPPASTTKVLTALVALENLTPDRQVTVTAEALHQAGDETTMGLQAGMRLRVDELLAGMFTVSANDAATALAADTVGLARFVAGMNDEVRALGLADSHFTSPVGLDDPAQRASAYDLAAITAVAVEHFPLLLRIASQPSIELAASDGHPAFHLPNLNRLLRLYPAAVGVKPGWTGDAGPCLVAMAVRDGHRLLAVLLDDPELYTDARALLDWGFVVEGLPSVLPTPTSAPPPPRPAPAAAPSRPARP